MIIELVVGLSTVLAQSAATEKNPHEGQEKIDPARMHVFDTQEVVINDFPADGWILDIGGGGEGVIGRMKGKQVVAIDLYSWGMRRTPAGPLKIVMDATDLKFLDNTFETVTSFFTLMYMTPEQQVKAAREAYRVLKPGGVFRIWDVELPVSPDPKQDLAIFKFTFRLPSETVETGYGTSFPRTPLKMGHFERLLTAAGFALDTRQRHGRVLTIVAVRDPNKH